LLAGVWGPFTRSAPGELAARKVEWPSYDQLRAELALSNFSTVGHKYGVTDNAVRKWLSFYERTEGEEAA
jgi:hypothetical protein